MSAGEFEVSRYNLSVENGGGIAPIRVQPETLQATINGVANDPPTGAVTLPVFVKVSKTRREYGIGPRKVLLRFPDGAFDDYTGDDIEIPVLQASTAAAWTNGQTGTYLGQNVEVVGRSPESVR